MTRVLFHLGMPKTGTTLLQNTLARSVPALRAEGVLYPRAGRVGAAHHPVAQTLRDKGPTERAAFLAELGGEIAAARAGEPGLRVALVSSEGMINVCVPAAAAGFAGFMADPGPGLHGAGVIFLREITAFLESFYLQTTRWRAFDMSFDDFIAPRLAWLGGFLGALRTIRDRMGNAFEIALADRDYDVLRAFEARLGLADGFLEGPSREVRPTGRPSLKNQIALTHIDWIAAQIGFPIARRPFLRLMTGERVFAGDVEHFTVYASGQRDQVAAACVAIMEEAGFGSYAALTRALAPADLPHHRLDRALLTPADFAVIASFREVIEDRPPSAPGADRAARQAARQAARKAARQA